MGYHQATDIVIMILQAQLGMSEKNISQTLNLPSNNGEDYQDFGGTLFSDKLSHDVKK